MPKTEAIGGAVGHQVTAYSDELAHAARSVLQAASIRARPTLWDLAALHAEARADAVWTRGPDGQLRGGAGMPQPALPDVPTFGAFLFRDLALPAGSLGAALRHMVVDEAERVTFEALLDELPG